MPTARDLVAHLALHTKEAVVKSAPWQNLQDYFALLGAGGWVAPWLTATAAPAIAPFAAATERFETAARAYLDAAGNAAAQADAAQAFGQAMRELFADFPVPWNATLGAAPPGAAPSSAFGAPALGAAREHQQRWQRLVESARRIADAQRRLQLLWSDAMRDAATAFTSRLDPSRAAQPASAAGMRELYNSWIDCAEDAYARTIHGEIFCTTLAEWVNAASQWRQELQAGLEQSAKLLDLPTRSEINSLAQRLKAVEDQLRATRRAPDTAAGSKTNMHGRPNAKPVTAAKRSKGARATRRSPHGKTQR